MKIVAATKNEGKLREFRQLLSGLDIEIVSQEDICPDLEVEETGETFEENARIKAKAVYDRTGLTCIADDSGLEVIALDCRPGVYSARYCGEDSGYDVKISALLKELEDKDDRSARFVCSICCVTAPDGEEITAKGVCNGEIGYELRGEGGFGYDPLFYFPQFNKTLAEVPADQKNLVSHRANAIKMFAEKLKALKIIE